MPSYTINTYFSRPGNGCHLHYDWEGGQHRTLSYREAARLQSFPDAFHFEGSKSDWAKQIGNAVPPLLGFQIARSLGAPGRFVDLFAGAGGLGLGFVWAGWEPVVANDFVPAFMATYAKNIHPEVVTGDLRDSAVREQLVLTTKPVRQRTDLPFAVLGGPPCQGFSTAGKRRSMEDDRNHLFREYVDMLDLVRPDFFVFENVTGLLNMDGGTVYGMIRDELATRSEALEEWVLNTHEYAVPQRRSRVVLVGHPGVQVIAKPTVLTELPGGKQGWTGLAASVSVSEALSDLPRLDAGQDGSQLGYASSVPTLFQSLMRGGTSPGAFLVARAGAPSVAVT
jgi:DNA (cytosine-5)-methyltransferase 1